MKMFYFRKQQKKIADLKKDIRRLSEKLKEKDSLLTGFVDVASVQAKRIACLNTNVIIQYTVLWDPSTLPQPALQPRWPQLRFQLPPEGLPTHRWA